MNIFYRPCQYKMTYYDYLTLYQSFILSLCYVIESQKNKQQNNQHYEDHRYVYVKRDYMFIFTSNIVSLQNQGITIHYVALFTILCSSLISR